MLDDLSRVGVIDADPLAIDLCMHVHETHENHAHAACGTPMKHA